MVAEEKCSIGARSCLWVVQASLAEMFRGSPNIFYAFFFSFLFPIHNNFRRKILGASRSYLWCSASKLSLMHIVCWMQRTPCPMSHASRCSISISKSAWCVLPLFPPSHPTVLKTFFRTLGTFSGMTTGRYQGDSARIQIGR